MTTINDLTKRVSTLEETVSHLTTHHDEQFVAIHDDMNAVDRCERLFNVHLRQRPPRRRTGRGKKTFKKATA